ncbi:flagellin [Niallia circulans]|uniref:Flagellin n=1 Tax=Niallia circulans TaxID=1397 RepID=A0A941GA58_NIACI|nr:flagellin [Niallia circulans]MCB5236231.1 flagellin [Niallia circulans]
MRINHNIAALNTYNKLNSATNAQSKSMEKLSSGLRINSASDDAAGLAISEKMRGQIRGLDQAAKNAQDGISLIQTAEGALSETTDILQRMRELATQASNDTNTTTDRDEIQKEINSLTSEINRIGNTTEFNTQKLLNGEKTTDTVATSGKLAGAAEAAANVTTGGTLQLKIDGETVDVTITDGDDTADVVTAINAAANTALSTTGETYASLEDGILNLTSLTSGKDSSVEVVGASAGSVLADLNLTATKSTGTAQGAGLQFQIGANEKQSMTLEISDMRASALGLTGTGAGFTETTDVSDGTDSTGVESGLDVSNAVNASKAITTIQKAIDTVSAERSKLGANQNRLDHTINNLSTSSENLTAAESRIRDVDYALAA